MISHWFTPDEKALNRPERLSKSSLWHKVVPLNEIDETIVSSDLLLISFDKECSRRIKRSLYQFSVCPNSSLRIVDCGVLIQKNAEAVLPVLQEISQSGALTLLLGAPMSFMHYQVGGLKMASIIRESNLDDDVHLRSSDSGLSIQYIATQRHLITESQKGVEGQLRLSDIRDDIHLAEPCIRDSDALIFHCDSLGAADTGYIQGMSSSGLNITEACQLFRFAGASQSLSSIGIYGYDPEADEKGITANSIAQMIWYFLEGSTLREDPEQSQLTQYIVHSKDHEHTLQFFKSEKSGRWWIQNKAGRKVACSYQDYKKACEEDYSDVVIRCVLG